MLGRRHAVAELLIAANPDEVPVAVLLRVPLAGGDLLFRTAGTWPREKALFAYPVPLDEWPDDPAIVETVLLRSCHRRGAAIDVIADRSRHNRSQLVYTQARGREAWCSGSRRAPANRRGRTCDPDRRAQGIDGLQIVVDSHEQYPTGSPASRSRPSSGPFLRGLRDRRRRSAHRQRGTQVTGRPGRRPHRRQAALIGWLIWPAAALGGGGRGPLFAAVQARSGPAGGRRRRARGTSGPLAERPGRVLRDAPARRGVDLPLPGAAQAWSATEDAVLQRISPTRVDIIALDGTPSEPTTAVVRAWANRRVAGPRPWKAATGDLVGVASGEPDRPGVTGTG